MHHGSGLTLAFALVDRASASTAYITQGQILKAMDPAITVKLDILGASTNFRPSIDAIPLQLAIVASLALLIGDTCT